MIWVRSTCLSTILTCDESLMVCCMMLVVCRRVAWLGVGITGQSSQASCRPLSASLRTVVNASTTFDLWNKTRDVYA